MLTLPSHIIYAVRMARWEPNATGRLVRAALDLFTEQGYDATTVSEIAERAGGLTKMTFFRHFPDKREVLFAAGQEIHSRLLADAIAAAPGAATPLAGRRRGPRRPHRHLHRTTAASSAPGCCAVIAGNSELRERAVFKRVGLAAAMAEALEKRGVPELTAGLAAELGIRAFYRAFDQWADPAGQQTLTELTRRALEQLRAATAALD